MVVLSLKWWAGREGLSFHGSAAPLWGKGHGDRACRELAKTGVCRILESAPGPPAIPQEVIEENLKKKKVSRARRAATSNERQNPEEMDRLQGAYLRVTFTQ